MGWRTIIVNEHSKLSYKNNHLIYKDSYETENIHLSEIDTLLIETTNVAITTMLVKRLIDENVLVIFCDEKRLPIAQLSSYYGRHDSSLQLSKQIAWDEKIKGRVWTEIIKQKIDNQKRVLYFFDYVDKADALATLSKQLEIFDPTNREGHAARTYFNTLFGNNFNREANNPINAGLNYGYTLMMSMFSRACILCGCMTQLGLKHANQFNHFNLASDIMEPFRPIVDIIVYNNKGQDFNYIKRNLFSIFTETYQYRNKAMYLSNIVTDYTKGIIKSMENNGEEIQYFGI